MTATQTIAVIIRMKPQAAAHLQGFGSDCPNPDSLWHPRNAALLQFLPAQIDCFQAAYLLGFQERDIKTLTRLGMLTPLGNPAQNAIKYYEAKDILTKAGNTKWLSDARNAVYENDAEQNARKKPAHSAPQLAAMAA